MRVLMFGWEFPPYKSGGLGTACYGMSRALAKKGTEILFVLPQILLLGDILIRKTKFTISRGAEATTHTGIIRINGRVRGTLDGIVDAEIHGVFKGTLNAVIDMGSVEELPEIIIPEPDRGGGEEQ